MMTKEEIDALMTKLVGKDWKEKNFHNLSEVEKIKLIEKAYHLGLKDGKSSSHNN